MTTPYPRDLVGYGPNPPHADWPGGARIAVNFVINYEEGSEYSVPDGDGFSETTLTEITQSTVPHGDRDLAAETLFEYGSRVGFWRLLRVFRERGVSPTIFACALALERNPEAAKAIVAGGYDICCHGWRWVEHYRLSEAEEREHIRRAIESLTRTLGARPLGWYCRTGPSVNTRRLLVAEGGFVYDSDSYADELPYWVRVGDQQHLVVPYGLTTNDGLFSRGGIGNGDQWLTFLKDSFDMLYAEGATTPRMMSIGLHNRLVGHPGRAIALGRFIDHIQRHDRVWFARRLDIANHWRTRHPPKG
ncbi:MAG: chitin deacetylase [Alphaproteobacteria bacterium]|nr:chitin deacetylase [Alphaproteobacteria bacterium]